LPVSQKQWCRAPLNIDEDVDVDWGIARGSAVTTH